MLESMKSMIGKLLDVMPVCALSNCLQRSRQDNCGSLEHSKSTRKYLRGKTYISTLEDMQYTYCSIHFLNNLNSYGGNVKYH